MDCQQFSLVIFFVSRVNIIERVNSIKILHQES